MEGKSSEIGKTVKRIINHFRTDLVMEALADKIEEIKGIEDAIERLKKEIHTIEENKMDVSYANVKLGYKEDDESISIAESKEKNLNEKNIGEADKNIQDKEDEKKNLCAKLKKAQQEYDMIKLLFLERITQKEINVLQYPEDEKLRQCFPQYASFSDYIQIEKTRLTQSRDKNTELKKMYNQYRGDMRKNTGNRTRVALQSVVNYDVYKNLTEKEIKQKYRNGKKIKIRNTPETMKRPLTVATGCVIASALIICCAVNRDKIMGERRTTTETNSYYNMYSYS